MGTIYSMKSKGGLFVYSTYLVILLFQPMVQCGKAASTVRRGVELRCRDMGNNGYRGPPFSGKLLRIGVFNTAV